MKQVVLAVLAVAAVVLLAAPVQAGGCGPACCAPCVTYVEQVVTCYQPVWRERDVVYSVWRPHYRDVVTDHVCYYLEPVWTDQKATVIEHQTVAKPVVYNVTRCRTVPVCVVDPCTGCAYTTCKVETWVEQVKGTVYECVPVKRDVVVKVCSYRQREHKYQVKHTICEMKEDKVKGKERYCEMQEVKMKVKVPVCCCIPCCW